MHTSTSQLSALLYLSSPALPIGAFAYSQGLEKAIELEWVTDRESLEAWCKDAISLGLIKLDLPLVLMLRNAIARGDAGEVEVLNQRVFACRESLELYEEELHLGASLTRLFRTQELADRLTVKFVMPQPPAFLTAFAVTSLSLELDDQFSIISFLWSWLENQVAVACKAVPLGQSDAQKLILNIKSCLPDFLENLTQPESLSELRGSLPGQALCSALHEKQYSRLFRS